MIWRYVSVAELINILDRRRLIFRQFRSLSRNDKAEGAIPEDLYDLDPYLQEDSEARLRGLRANIDLLYCTYVQCGLKPESGVWTSRAGSRQRNHACAGNIPRFRGKWNGASFLSRQQPEMAPWMRDCRQINMKLRASNGT